jgi:hypothetical protein
MNGRLPLPFPAPHSAEQAPLLIGAETASSIHDRCHTTMKKVIWLAHRKKKPQFFYSLFLAVPQLPLRIWLKAICQLRCLPLILARFYTGIMSTDTTFSKPTAPIADETQLNHFLIPQRK